MGLGQEVADPFENCSVEDNFDKQAERMELEDFAGDLRKVEDNHCSLEASVLLIDHHQSPYE